MIFVSGKGNESAKYLHSLACSIQVDSSIGLGKKLVVCAGGDGTLLDAINTYGCYYQYLPINMGTRGYLMNRRQTHLQMAEAINNWELKAHQFFRLEVPFTDIRAFNEISVVPSGDQAAKLMVYVNDSAVSQEPVIGSGVIISTAQGSTGWNMACGGSAVHPLADVLCLTFINAYSPRVPPMVIPRESTVRIEVAEHAKRPCVLKVDGKTQLLNQEEYIIRRANNKVAVAYNNDHDFTRRMIGKVIR